MQGQASILLRYAYEGGSLSQGRLCSLEPEPDGSVTGRTLLTTLKADGVDLARFYPCAAAACRERGPGSGSGQDQG